MSNRSKALSRVAFLLLLMSSVMFMPGRASAIAGALQTSAPAPLTAQSWGFDAERQNRKDAEIDVRSNLCSFAALRLCVKSEHLHPAVAETDDPPLPSIGAAIVGAAAQ